MLFDGRSIPKSVAVTGGWFNKLVVHPHVAEAKIVHDCGREQVRLVDREENVQPPGCRRENPGPWR